jgi:hypothetical protein
MPIDNPFLKQAVARFGDRLKTCAPLSYMTPIENAVAAFLRAQDRTSEHESSPIAITGGHGSGKTHLLTWLAAQIESISSANASCLYGKADSDSFVDLYRELLKGISRPQVMRVMTDAVKNLAEAKVRGAKVSESLAKPIRESSSLDPYVDAGYLDKNELQQALRRQLAHLDPKEPDPEKTERGDVAKISPSPELAETMAKAPDGKLVEKHDTTQAWPSAGFAGTMAKVIMLIDDPDYGDLAFAWLRGENTAALAQHGVVNSLFELASSGQRTSADAAAINALESIAALFRLADRPLSVMIDQLEVFIRSSRDPSRLETIYSLIKKLVEQLKLQGTLVILAGAPDAWENLRRDVWPRLSDREPFKIGNLNLDETRLLLETYTKDIKGLPTQMLEKIHVLSGGSPREIIRIGYQMFTEVGGDWSKLTGNILKTSAVNAGSVKERVLLALELTDKILGKYGTPSIPGGGIEKDLLLTDEVRIQRLLRIPGGQTFAFTFFSPTDPLTEVDAVRHMVVVRERLHQHFPNALLFVVAVGYSSQEVQKMLEPTSITLRFLEETYESILQIELAKRAEIQPTTTSATDSLRLTEAIKSLEEEVRRLAVERAESVRDSQAAFEAKVQQRTIPEIQAKELKTRWEVIEGLDALHERLLEEDLSGERRLMRSLLVANELNIRDSAFDYGGSIYLDLIDTHVLLLRRAGPQPGIIEQDIVGLRSEIIGVLRRLLRPKNDIQKLLERPNRAALLTFLFVLLLIVITATSLPFFGLSIFYYSKEGYDGLSFVGLQLFAIGVTLLLGLPYFMYSAAVRRGQTEFHEFERRAKTFRDRTTS